MRGASSVGSSRRHAIESASARPQVASAVSRGRRWRRQCPRDKNADDKASLSTALAEGHRPPDEAGGVPRGVSGSQDEHDTLSHVPRGRPPEGSDRSRDQTRAQAYPPARRPRLAGVAELVRAAADSYSPGKTHHAALIAAGVGDHAPPAEHALAAGHPYLQRRSLRSQTALICDFYTNPDESFPVVSCHPVDRPSQSS